MPTQSPNKATGLLFGYLFYHTRHTEATGHVENEENTANYVIIIKPLQAFYSAEPRGDYDNIILHISTRIC